MLKESIEEIILSTQFVTNIAKGNVRKLLMQFSRKFPYRLEFQQEPLKRANAVVMSECIAINVQKEKKTHILIMIVKECVRHENLVYHATTLSEKERKRKCKKKEMR
jgi:hypothetical protein